MSEEVDEERRRRAVSVDEQRYQSDQISKVEVDKEGEGKMVGQDDERRRRAVSVDERRHPSSRRPKEDVRLRGVSVDESPPGENYASRQIGGQRLRVGVSLDDQRANIVKDNSRDALIPVSIGVEISRN